MASRDGEPGEICCRAKGARIHTFLRTLPTHGVSDERSIGNRGLPRPNNLADISIIFLRLHRRAEQEEEVDFIFKTRLELKYFESTKHCIYQFVDKINAS